MSFDSRGLVVPRFPDIIQNIEDYQVLESPKKFKYQDNKLIYQLNSVYARVLDDVSQLAEAAFDTLKLSAAEGANLEELGLLRGVYRIPATHSTTSSQYAVMAEGATIQANTLFTAATVNETVYNPDLVVGNPSKAAEVLIRISNVIDSTSYPVTINGTTYTFTSDLDATDDEIQAGLQAEFDDDVGKTFTYTLDGTDGIQLIADVDTTLNVAFTTTDLVIENLKIYFTVIATNTGPIAIPANTVDTIQGASVGVVSTNNDETFLLGREEETDAELRTRISNGITSDCTGTILSIQGSLLDNVIGVTSAQVFENTDTAPTDADGRPIHSYETLVVGGSDEDVAQEIWATKPVGIELFGNTTETITDESGISRLVDFSRPTQLFLAIRVQYVTYDEESLPGDANSAISDTVLEHINSLPLGKDVITDRLIGPIYQAVPLGLGNLTIEVQGLAASGDPVVPGNWTEDTFAVAGSEYATIAVTDITIEDVTP